MLFCRLNIIETNSVYDATSQGSRCQLFVVGCLKRAAAWKVVMSLSKKK